MPEPCCVGNDTVQSKLVRHEVHIHSFAHDDGPDIFVSPTEVIVERMKSLAYGHISITIVEGLYMLIVLEWRREKSINEALRFQKSSFYFSTISFQHA